MTLSPDHERGGWTRINLPFPPSANNLFVNVPKRGRVRSSRYSMWREEAGWMIREQRPPSFIGPVAVTITLVPKDKRRRDADNGAKAVLDLLVSHGVIAGDDNRIVRKVTIQWCDVGAHCAVFVEQAA